MRNGGVLNTEIDVAPLRRLLLDETNARGIQVDADQVLAILARWIGWYRLESQKLSTSTPREQRTEAAEIVLLISQLREKMQPHNMSPAFRAELQENMRRLNVAAPDWARLEACARKAGESLPTPRKGERSDTRPKHNAIRETYNVIRGATTPQMDKEAAAALASDLVSIAAGIATPSDRDELRRITRGS